MEQRYVLHLIPNQLAREFLLNARHMAVPNLGYGMLLAASHNNKIQQVQMGIIRNVRGPAGKFANAAGLRALLHPACHEGSVAGREIGG